MLFNLLADMVLVLHATFILFVITGAPLVLFRRWIAWLHIPVVIWAVLLELNQWICPLTPLENFLRRSAGGETYDEGFIEHYLTVFIYPGWLTPDIQIVMGVSVALLNILIYGFVIYRVMQSSPNGNH